MSVTHLGIFSEFLALSIHSWSLARVPLSEDHNVLFVWKKRHADYCLPPILMELDVLIASKRTRESNQLKRYRELLPEERLGIDLCSKKSSTLSWVHIPSQRVCPRGLQCQIGI
ncbi:hypothetical protein FPV67DRAFT_1480533 [Lyophyllum atratum]|nr:hypothetical protein FPV67DRAFT_1480533 [Lyophyllum atratum]